MPQRRFGPTGFFGPAKESTETSGDVIGDDCTSTPDSSQLDFSPMRLGVAKTARESANRQISLKLRALIRCSQRRIRPSAMRKPVRVLDSTGKLERHCVQRSRSEVVDVPRDARPSSKRVGSRGKKTRPPNPVLRKRPNEVPQVHEERRLKPGCSTDATPRARVELYLGSVSLFSMI